MEKNCELQTLKNVNRNHRPAVWKHSASINKALSLKARLWTNKHGLCYEASALQGLFPVRHVMMTRWRGNREEASAQKKKKMSGLYELALNKGNRLTTKVMLLAHLRRDTERWSEHPRDKPANRNERSTCQMSVCLLTLLPADRISAPLQSQYALQQLTSQQLRPSTEP